MLNQAPVSDPTRAGEPVCVACARPRATVVLSKGDLTVVRCAECGHLYLRAWRDELARFDELYGYFRERRGALDLRMSAVNRRRLAELCGELGALVSGRRLLDVGAGEGKLVYVAGQLGWSARGIDLAEHAVASCRAAGLPIENLDFFDPALSNARFDVISMCELLEHVPDPVRFLARAEQLLAPGGILYFTTPNFDALSRRLLGEDWRMIHPQHISYFTEPFLRRMVLERTRFEIVTLETRNLSLGTLAIAAQKLIRRTPTEVRAPSASVSAGERRAWNVDQGVRRVSQTRAGGALKRWANAAAAFTGVGDSIVGVLRRTTSEPS
jgi:2-polyprenyl-3-methyl-5-hydroxy-6-metoxy-1,4-benzoquinol methylase